ncbi:MAG: acylglycerol kinase family protein [Desulfobacterales bacterium]
MSKIVFIVNPHAGNGSTGSNWSYIESVAKDRMGHFEIYMTQRSGDAVMVARNAIAKDAELLVCVGGDGTLNEVINGIMLNNTLRILTGSKGKHIPWIKIRLLNSCLMIV